MEFNMQCPLTSSWRTNKNGSIATIISDRNRPNQFGIKYEYGKRKGQLKKNKNLTQKDIDKLLEADESNEEVLALHNGKNNSYNVHNTYTSSTNHDLSEINFTEEKELGNA